MSADSTTVFPLRPPHSVPPPPPLPLLLPSLGVGMVMMLVVKEDKRRTRAGTTATTTTTTEGFENKRAEEMGESASTETNRVSPAKNDKY